MTVWEEAIYYIVPDATGDRFEYKSYDTIIDVGVYSSSGGCFFNSQFPDLHYLGYNDTSQFDSEGSVLYKFADFYHENGRFANLEYDEIYSVKLYMPLVDEPVSRIEAYQLTAGGWNQDLGDNPSSITNWQLVGSKDLSTAVLADIKVVKDEYDIEQHKAVIDVTQMAINWSVYKTSNTPNPASNPENGFIVSMDSATDHTEVYSVENSFYPVYYEVETIDENSTTYYADNLQGNYYINQVDNARFLRCSSSLQVMNFDTKNLSYYTWYIEYVGNSEYIIHLQNSLGNILYSSLTSKQVLRADKPANIESKHKWRILFEDGNYKFINSYNGEYLSGYFLPISTIRFSDTVEKESCWMLYETDDFINLSSFNCETLYWMNSTFGSELTINIRCSPYNYSFNTENFYTVNNETFDSYNDTIVFNGVEYENGYKTLLNFEYIDSNTIKFTANGEDGYVILNIRHEPSGTEKKIVIVIGQLIPDGTYFLQNISTDLYMDVEFMTHNEVPVDQKTFIKSSRQQWLFEYQGNGRYRIINYVSRRYVSVDSAGTGIIQTGTLSNASLWQINVSTMGNLVLRSVQYPNYALSSPSATSVDGVDLANIAYTNNATYNDEWLIETIPYNCDVCLFGVVDEYVTGRYFDKVLENLKKIEYTNNNVVHQGSIGPESIGSLMRRSKIFVIHTHGFSNCISTSVAQKETEGAFYATDYLPDDSLDNTELVIYISCNTGSGGADATNLVTQTAAKGARTVIGFKGDISQFVCDEWYSLFFENYQKAISGADPTITDYEVLCQITYSQLCEWAKNYNQCKEPKISESILLEFQEPTIAGEISFKRN